jgi:hypothetical protein
MPYVGLDDALRLVLLPLDREPERFEAPAGRWHSRLCKEARLDFSDAHLALAALHSLTNGESGLHALLGLSKNYGLQGVTRVL